MYKIKEGFNIIKQAMGFVFKHPKGLFPFFFSWGINLLVGYSVYSNVDFTTKTDLEIGLIIFGLTVVFTALVSISSLILLELIEQYELTGRMSLVKAIYDAFVKDLYRAIPVIIAWAIVKFMLLIAKVAVSAGKKKRSGSSSYRSSRSSRRASSFLNTIETGARMAMFLVLPAIAWEPISPIRAAEKGVDVYKTHLIHMVTGLYLSKILSFITFVPAGIVVFFGSQMGMLTEEVIIGLVIYVGITWSFGMMVEQLYTAELYIWYKKYEEEKGLAHKNNIDGPKSMKDVKRPSIFDNVQDFTDDQYYVEQQEYKQKEKKERY